MGSTMIHDLSSKLLKKMMATIQQTTINPNESQRVNEPEDISRNTTSEMYIKRDIMIIFLLDIGRRPFLLIPIEEFCRIDLIN